MAHLAGLHHRIERVQGFLDRRLGGAVLVPIAEAAEVVGGAVRPVELIEVDMVRLQPLQARLDRRLDVLARSEEHTSELQSLMRISYAVFCLTKTKHNKK